MNVKSFLYLCENIPLDPEYNFTLDFDNITAQNNYFDSKISSTLTENDDYSFIRKDEEIRVYANIDDLFGVNYMYFINDTKRYYAFITDKRYISDTCTALIIKLDVMQTFMFDYTIKESFIDREHQDRWKKIGNNFNPIFNTKPENIDYGNEYVTQTGDLPVLKIGDDEVVFVYIFANTKLHNVGFERFVDNYIPNGHYLYCNICLNREVYEDNEVLAYKIGADAPTEERLLPLQAINNLIDNSYIDQIIISKIPPVEMAVTSSNLEDGGYCLYPIDSGSIDAYPIEINGNGDKLIGIYSRNARNMLSTIKEFSANYFPIINHNSQKRIENETKLLTHPYSFGKVYYGTNELDIKEEYAQNAKIKIYQSLCSEASSLLVIDDYLNTNGLNTMHVISNKIPNNIDLVTNAWKEYILANKAQRKAGFISSALNIGTSVIGAVATGGVSLATGAMGALNTATQIGTQLAKEHDIKNQPNDIKQFGDDIGINLITSNLLPKLVSYKITDEYKTQVYDYFYHYGYKASCFKIPDTRSRYYFNYIKTIGINIESNIDAMYINELKRIYDTGITIWHYRTDFKGVNNYNYENAEISMEE